MITLEAKRWLGRGCWIGLAAFFGWVAMCGVRTAEAWATPALYGSGAFGPAGYAAGPLLGLLNWGVPAAAVAAGTLGVLARQRIVPVERVMIVGTAVLAVTLILVTLGNSFCREILGTASLAEGVWWWFIA